MDLMVDYSSFSVETIEICASVLELACAHPSAKYAPREDRHNQKGKQLLVRGIKEIKAKDTLCLALGDAKAIFSRPVNEPLLHQRPVIRQRAESVSQPATKTNLQLPSDGQKFYFLHQTMDFISLGSASF
jgi:hypothetical protein